MKAVTWHGKRDVRVDEVPDPRIEDPTDAIVRITSTNICGSDLHLYEVLGPFLGIGMITAVAKLLKITSDELVEEKELAYECLKDM